MVVRFSVQDVRAIFIEIPVDSRARSAGIPSSLTSSEREVVALLVAGLSTQEIAERRQRSYRTIANQLAAVYRKLRVAGRTELVARLGLEE